jgi:hypothetical protein
LSIVVNEAQRVMRCVEEINVASLPRKNISSMISRSTGFGLSKIMVDKAHFACCL